MRSMDTAKVEGLWLVNGPKCLVPRHPDDSNNSPEAWSCSPFIVPSLLQHKRLFMASHSDVMIICSIFLVGKPLHMCISAAMVHLRMFQHAHWNPLLLQKLQTSSSIFQPPFCACDIYIYRREIGPPQSVNHTGLAYHYTAAIYI